MRIDVSNESKRVADERCLVIHAPLSLRDTSRLTKTTRRREIIRDGVRDDRRKGGSGHQDRDLRNRPPEGRGDQRELAEPER
jgi:hypothetical protein